MLKLKTLTCVLLSLMSFSSAQAFIDATAVNAMKVAEMRISTAKLDGTKLAALAHLKEVLANRLAHYDELPPVQQLDYNDFRAVELNSLTEFNINLKQIKFPTKHITKIDCERSRDQIMLYSERESSTDLVSSETQKTLNLLDLICKK